MNLWMRLEVTRHQTNKSLVLCFCHCLNLLLEFVVKHRNSGDIQVASFIYLVTASNFLTKTRIASPSDEIVSILAEVYHNHALVLFIISPQFCQFDLLNVSSASLFQEQKCSDTNYGDLSILLFVLNIYVKLFISRLPQEYETRINIDIFIYKLIYT